VELVRSGLDESGVDLRVVHGGSLCGLTAARIGRDGRGRIGEIAGWLASRATTIRGVGVTDVDGATTRLVGRKQECAQIDRLLANAVAGESGILVIRGEPGIGKTALLAYAAERASGMLVLRASGAEAESDLAFAGLYGLVRPILGHLDEVPAIQSAALAGALGLGPSTGADRFLVSAAVLGLLAGAAEERPILCLVDDAQWLDTPSADALVFAARRLGADPVAMVFGAREGEPRRFDAPGLPGLLVRGLDHASGAALLDSHAGEASPAVRERLLAEAHGNPLALIELPAGLTYPQLSGTAPLPDAIPLTPRLKALFRERIERLPEPTQTALLVAAASSVDAVEIVASASRSLELGDDALDPAETASLIHTEGGALKFRHPLVRSAIYDAASPTQRQVVHAAIAGVLTGEKHADRRVWHLAMATSAPDEEVAAALEASAHRAVMRAAHASAASSFLRAADLSTDDIRRYGRIAAAGQAAWDAGDVERVRDLIAGALPAASGEPRALLLHLAGVLEWRTGRLHEACTIMSRGAELTADPSLRLEMLFDAAEAASHGGDPASVIELADRAARIKASSERDRVRQALLIGFGRLYAGQREEAGAPFADALERASTLEDPRTLVWAAEAASTVIRLGAGLPYASRAVELARAQGRLNLLQLALRRLASELIWNSHFDVAYATAQEGYGLSLEAGDSAGGHLANLAFVEAVWGREQEARDHAAVALALGQRHDSLLVSSMAEWALGFVELTAGRLDEAADRLLALTAAERTDVHPMVARYALSDAVEAASRGSHRAEASERLVRLRSAVNQAHNEARHALLSRCEAVLGERPPDDAFAEALSPAVSEFERARTELLYGEWLRRERRRQEARGHLRTALELFRGVGAVTWEDRAAAELRATGETARKRDPSTLDKLTPQELHIAGLVAEGLTNRDIATQLYLSPRTIDYHLRKVFSKLGIASRTELVRNGLPQRGPAEPV
jgi:DNA-binding CsgD family transcriptional regulator